MRRAIGAWLQTYYVCCYPLHRQAGALDHQKKKFGALVAVLSEAKVLLFEGGEHYAVSPAAFVKLTRFTQKFDARTNAPTGPSRIDD
jgi:hypothetical protein